MSFRKWVVRGLVTAVLGGCIAAGVLYQQWTNPVAVRQQVVDMLLKSFPGATVTLDGARLRLLGGVVLTELRLTRRAGDDKSEILHIPSATVYHDKEHLLDGQFAVRRIELHRPRIHIVRNKDGTWNVSNLMGIGDARTPLPTIVVQGGSLVIEDRMAGSAQWELHDVNLTLLNDPIACVAFAGTGKSESLGNVEIHGTWQRDSGVTTLALAVTNLSVNKELVQYISSLYPDPRLIDLQLDGAADLKVNLVYTPDAKPALTHDIHCQLRQFRVEHPKLPVPLHNLSASIHCDGNKLTLERLKAAAGKGHLECTGWADAARPEDTFALELTALHLPLTKELADRLPESVKRQYYLYHPVGIANMRFQYEVKAGEPVRKHIALQPDNVNICYERFKYPIDRVSGTIEYDFLQQLTTFDAVGYAGTQPVKVNGHWKGSGQQADALVDIVARGVPLDKKVLDALNEDTQKIANAFHPTGQGDFHGLIRHVPGEVEFQSLYHIHFVDCKVKWNEFAYPLEKVSGDLLIRPPYCEFKDFHGEHNGSDVYVSGQTLPRKNPTDPDGKLVLAIAGRNMALDGDLQSALKAFPGLEKTWDTFAPTGHVSFAVQVERLPGHPSDLDVTVDAAGCGMQAAFFPFSLCDVTGRFHYAKNQLEISNFTARHDTSRMSIEQGIVDLYPQGGYYVKLKNFIGNPMLANNELLRALPEGLRSTFEAINLKDQSFAFHASEVAVSQSGELGKRPEIYWNTALWVRDANLRAGIDLQHVTGTVGCRGLHDGNKMVGLIGNIFLNEATVYKQPLHDVHTHFFIPDKQPDVMVFTLTRAPFYGGDICGSARLEFGSSLHYDIDLTASQIHLEEFGRENIGEKQQMNGIAAARLHLHGHGGSVNNMEGNGSIDVPYNPLARLLDLPPLVALLKFLGLRWPDRTAFEEAHAVFTIHGQRASVSKLDLLGDVISLYGQGEVNLDGTDVMLDFYPSWGRAEQMLPTAVRSIPSAISKQLMKIEMRGNIGGSEGDLKFSKLPVPGLIDPLLQMRDRVVGWTH